MLLNAYLSSKACSLKVTRCFNTQRMHIYPKPVFCVGSFFNVFLVGRILIPNMAQPLLNDWDKNPVISRDKIMEIEFLTENEYITHIADGYFYLNTEFSIVESKYYQALNKKLMKELNIEDVEKSLKALIAKYNKYNEIKDVAEELCGSVANFRGLPIKDIHEELEMPVER